MFGYTGETTEQLVEHVTTKLQDLGGNFTNAACSYDIGADRIQLDFDGYNVDITWDDTDLQTILGFEGTQNGDPSYGAVNPPKYVWNPTYGVSYYPLGLNQFWNPKSTTYVGRSTDGTTYSVNQSIVYDAKLAWQLLPDSDVIILDSGQTNGELQTFFEDIIAKGYPVRIHLNRDILDSDQFKTGIVMGESEDEPVGSFMEYTKRYIKNYNGLWNVNLNFIKYQVAS